MKTGTDIKRLAVLAFVSPVPLSGAGVFSAISPQRTFRPLANYAYCIDRKPE
ncbi:hypothetical protein [Collimonas arenae]|uniref:hypothetical protein n=1 Tax=Collimonas arenae TaxID=279058 RepID=UPI0013E2E504|nr:hypothetical protein [Collimonas arenae]